MPELPEVEVVRRGLERWVAGRSIASVEVHHPRAVRRHLGGAEHFVAALTGRTVTAAHRRGKYLWLPLAEADGTPAGQALVAHLGMSGQLLVEKPAQPDEIHLRARFTFTDGGRELRFVDQRTFGGLAVEDADGEQLPKRLAHIAIDPLLAESATRGAGLDWKTSLQELGSAAGLGAPVYEVEDDGPDHAKTFTAVVLLGGQVRGKGTGRTKKAAEQEAAEAAWRALTDTSSGSGPPRGSGPRG